MNVNGQIIDIIKPIVAVEVKPYTDATMFGEIQNSCKLLRNCSPFANAYVYMGYNQIGQKHMVSAKYVAVNQMFALREDENSPMLSYTFQEYYNEISSFVESYRTLPPIPRFGKLISN